jgi:DNA-binding MltR family transcriptional regulator
MKKKEYFTISELSEDIQYLYNTMNNSTDTACVLIAANFIDKCLANALLIRLPIKDKDFIKNDLLDFNNGILATYSSRNKMAYSLKIIDKQYYEDISTIGKIRNSFAHNHLEISFKDLEVKTHCNKLTLWKSGFPPFQREQYKKLPQSNSSEICKIKFVNTATDIINKFVGLGLIHKIIYKEDI